MVLQLLTFPLVLLQLLLQLALASALPFLVKIITALLVAAHQVVTLVETMALKNMIKGHVSYIGKRLFFGADGFFLSHPLFL